MNEPKISPDFTIEDIHRIREHNYEVTKNMTFDERMKYYNEKADRVLKSIKERRELMKTSAKNK